MAQEPLPGEQPGKLEALLERWQTSLDLHARYAALDDARYWHVQPWPKHERPQRWIIQLARKRILALKRIVAKRLNEGDADFIEGIETMAFLASLVGLTSVERFIPLATHETERREVLDANPDETETRPPPESARPRATPVAEPARPRALDNRRTSDTGGRTGEHRRAAETTRQMPALSSKATPRAPAQAQARREPRRETPRPAAAKPKKAPSTITQAEHVVIADAVRLLGWGKQWHEVAEMITRLAERPAPSEIRRILRTYHEHIDAIVTRRRD
jgi:pyruvate/2-oxoglutarate dehydrogenase complex dihydrolipoamide acyltransferase (E2) component